MNREEKIVMVAGKIDHAVLNPSDGDMDVIKACEIAKRYKTASVCVKPCHVQLAINELEGSGIAVCTVIGFPHGGTTTGIKYAEAVEALRAGASEIDMVINIGKLKEDNDNYVFTEIEFITRITHQMGGILKVIIETALLNEEQKIKACKIAESAGADYVKTSTGFASGGADIKDVKLMRSVLGTEMKIKASGGIKTLDQAVEFINAGCDRLGTSKTESILQGQNTDGEY